MRVLEAVRLVRAGTLALPTLWTIATDPEQATIALLLGRPGELPIRARTIEAAWAVMNQQQRRLVRTYGPPGIILHLPHVA